MSKPGQAPSAKGPIHPYHLALIMLSVYLQELADGEFPPKDYYELMQDVDLSAYLAFKQSVWFYIASSHNEDASLTSLLKNAALDVGRVVHEPITRTSIKPQDEERYKGIFNRCFEIFERFLQRGEFPAHMCGSMLGQAVGTWDPVVGLHMFLEFVSYLKHLDQLLRVRLTPDDRIQAAKGEMTFREWLKEVDNIQGSNCIAPSHILPTVTHKVRRKTKGIQVA